MVEHGSVNRLHSLCSQRLGGRGRARCPEQRGVGLLFPFAIAVDRLSQDCRGGGDVQNIVGDLKHQAQPRRIGIRRRQNLFPDVGRNTADSYGSTGFSGNSSGTECRKESAKPRER